MDPGRPNSLPYISAETRLATVAQELLSKSKLGQSVKLLDPFFPPEFINVYVLHGHQYQAKAATKSFVESFLSTSKSRFSISVSLLAQIESRFM
jgi:hypothetical protein